MKREKVFELLGGMDDALITEAKKEKKMNFKKAGVAVAAGLLLAAVVSVPFFGGNGFIDPQRGYRIVEMTGELIGQRDASISVYRFPEEILGMNTEIFRGTITDVENIAVEFANGQTLYRARAKVAVSETLRGEATVGETVTLLLPEGFFFPTPNESIHTTIEDCLVAERMTAGMEGIFMVRRLGAEEYSTAGNMRVMLTDLGDYGMYDGERFCFLDTETGLVMSDLWQDAFADATLDGAEGYIREMLTSF